VSALDDQLRLAEKTRRRERTEQGRSPAQRTTRSRNKARALKRPGKGQRHNWKNES
jgi:hypothetical protein